MPRKARHTKSVPAPPPEIIGFLAEVGEVVREYLEAKRRAERTMLDNADDGAHDDESGGIYSSQ